MTTNKYFTLADSTGSRVKRFRVLIEGYKPMLTKSETITRTLQGEIDVSRGALYEIHEYLIRVREAVEDSNDGTLDDLRYFYSLNNPNASPSDILTLTDHFGNSHYVAFTKDFVPDPVSVVIEGIMASFIVKCTFEFFNEDYVS